MLYLVDGIIDVNVTFLLSRILARSSLLVRADQELWGGFCTVSTSRPHERAKQQRLDWKSIMSEEVLTHGPVEI